MAALAGRLVRSGREADQDAVGRMLAAAPHRGGPSTIVTVGGAAVGIALTEGADHAWLARDRDLVVAFVGFLDNASTLEKRLRDIGTTGVLATSADIVLHAVRQWGVDGSVVQLRGAFAVIITDGRQMWCMRDHFGAKTLFYRHTTEAFDVATEAKQVAATGPHAPAPDVAALEAYFYGRLTDELPSLLSGVQRLPRRHVLTVDGVGAPPRLRRYWDPERLLESATLTADDASERFMELFEQATRRCLTGADAVSLSGGIDSTAIAAVAAAEHLQLAGRPLGAVSAVFPDHPNVDERGFIELVARDLGLDLVTHVPTARTLDDIETWVRLLDGPVSAVSIPELAEHYRFTRGSGYRTLLMGDVAEALFDMTPHLFGHLLLRGRFATFARTVAAQRRAGRRWKVLARMTASSLVPARPFLAYSRWRRINWIKLPGWIDPAKMGGLGIRSDLATPARQRWERLQVAELVGPIISWEADDIVGAVTGVNSRVPFADVDLWEFFLSLRADVKYPDGLSKTFVRRALRGRLPDAILDRRDKTVFDDWNADAVDWGLLRRWLVDPSWRMPGVDYDALAARLAQQDMSLRELMWANDLVGAHAFMAQW